MRRLNLTTERVYLVWGIFDAIYIARYVLLSISAGRVPYIDDFNNAMGLLAVHGGVPKVLAGFVWGLEISIVLSCSLFLLRWRVARWLAYIQVPLRLILFVPSISVLFMGPNIKDRYGIVLLVSLLIMSEGLKVWTLWGSRSCSRVLD
jgi:hypothetical protein